MLRLAASLAAIAALPLLAATAGSAFEVQGQQGGAASAEAASFWQRFTLDSGQAGGVALRGHRMPQLAPTLTPMVGLNYENARRPSARCAAPGLRPRGSGPSPSGRCSPWTAPLAQRP